MALSTRSGRCYELPTDKQRANLKRGGLPATPETAQRARDAKDAEAERLTRFGQLAREDRGRAVLKILLTAAEGLSKRLDSWVKRGGDPPPQVIPLCREIRLYCENAIRYSKERGDSAEVDAIIGEGGILDVAFQRLEAGEDLALPELPPPDENDPHEILERLWGLLAAGVEQCAGRIERGEAATNRSIEAMREFRLLSDALAELDGDLGVSRDKGLAELLAVLPDKHAIIKERLDNSWTPPLEPSKRTDDQDDDGASISDPAAPERDY